ncbi:rhomboid family intramembrane serine protease [Spiractinospora alimapuensis]|uniref:rhomboid family intramembrane serine protease n=1 Tax=Spiractinospora alimapuensis TaxID=2820884 RepID=UPI001F2C669C|nr:rhomboid family intramembrane serine protease [Spiractinospora alimapuensis]QVQ53232.1 rhomboid family intramembrane serine protease [Spiractinospora alimapuensis]
MAVVPLSDDYPIRRVPVVTYTLIAVTVAVYLLSPLSLMAVWYSAEPLVRFCQQDLYVLRWGAIPVELLTGDQLPGTPPSCGGDAAEFTKYPWVAALTAQFLHGDEFHLLFNMIYLFVFGPTVEDRLGRVRYGLFYLGTGIAATVGFSLGEPSSGIPLVGASGAILGVLGAYMVVQFRSRVVSLVFGLIPVRLPGWAFVATYFLIDYVHYVNQGLLPDTQTEVAYGAHVYGFIAGVIGGLLVYRIRWRGGPRLNVG